MDKRIISLLVLVILFAGAAGCSGTAPPATPTPTAEPTQSVPPETTTVPTASTTPVAGTCSSDDDCVPAQCCHPSGCTLKTEAPACNGTMCTAVCSGPLDCGAGSCGCVDGKCVVESSSSGSSAAVTTPSFWVDASPRRYSPVMSSTPGVKLEPKATGISLEGATFNWAATKGQFISWGAPDYVIHVLGNPATSTTEPVYWTFTERTSSPTIPVIITVIAMDPASSSLLGNAQVTLTWDGSYAVIVGNTS